MNILYLLCSVGAAGDMPAAALLELLPDREGFINKFESMRCPCLQSFWFCGLFLAKYGVL